MKILVIGSGGREHALAWKLRQSPHADRIFCAPGNAGTADVGENVAIPVSDLGALVRFAKENHVGLTVVGPDDPLAAGIVDLFTAEKLRAFGPTKSAARIEASKIFAKELMRAQEIPTAEARTFSDSGEALRYCEQVKFPVVIKADGLALGKGVIVATDLTTVQSTINEMMNERRFGDAGRRIVIEEFLCGTECSLHALVDGKNYLLLQSARDHKRALDGDQGPNTGGMGAFSPANNWDSKLQSRFETEIMQPLLRGFLQQGIQFRGLLYPGLIITSEGARVLEFNCRFGDPETQALLPRMKSDLLPLLEATIDGRIAACSIEWDTRAAVTVVLASGGYPGKYETGKTISGLEEAAKLRDVQIFHAGTKRANGEVKTSGGRVLAITALGETIEDARERAYEAAARIHFENCHYRRDIALSAVAANIDQLP
ncbi:MAG: phosphoribosylamine--glycine ligase [Verrucomicrobia bacterium]|nr:MAG: phosphoribosylamine--glycine ligase [Verrucomicrobiota bacterium]PYL63134.1 MAG: phosphoribosylamine--glycine ligase [Verrucomicrobiota bacterium]